jgi:hypothetical protein
VTHSKTPPNGWALGICRRPSSVVRVCRAARQPLCRRRGDPQLSARRC